MELQKDNLFYNISNMNLVRAVACLGVVLTHARFVLWSGGRAYLAHSPISTWDWYEYPLYFLDLVTSIGPARVFFFFILSGFFLQYSVRDQFQIQAFMRSRFLRLYPAYVAAILLGMGALYLALAYINPALATGPVREFNHMIRVAAAELSWSTLGQTLLFNSRATPFAAMWHLWSLLHEVVFCLLFPLYHRLTPRSRMATAAAALALGWLADSMLLQAQLYFLIGMLFYDFFARGHRLPWAFSRRCFQVAFLGLFLATYGANKLGLPGISNLLMIVFAFLLFDFMLSRPIKVSRVLGFISKASYAIYLNHTWALLLYYAVLSRLTGEQVFYSRWPYYSGVIVAVLGSLPAYWLIDKPIGAYLTRTKQLARAYKRPQLVPHVSLSEERVGSEVMALQDGGNQDLAVLRYA